MKEQSPSTKSSLSCSISREKSDSLSFSSHQLLRALQLGVGFYEFLLIHVGILSDLTLCKPCACSPSYHEFMCAAALSCPADTVFYKLYFFRFLKFFLFPLPQWSLSALSPSPSPSLSVCICVCNMDILFRVEHSTVFCMLTNCKSQLPYSPKRSLLVRVERCTNV